MKVIAVTNDQMENTQLIKKLLKIESLIDAVILREKSKSDSDVVDLIRQLLTQGFDDTKIIVHSRIDIASSIGINKVQLPGHMPLSTAKTDFPDISFGQSVHSLDEAEVAYEAGADWLLYGHLFATGSKEGLPPRGTAELFRMTASLPIPVYAIGGIQPHHLPLLNEGGVSGVAVMSSFFGSDKPEVAAEAYKEASYVTKR